jgi:hypothetical protein
MTPTPQEKCDLVMKGGITSGVVYPRAVMVLGTKYRFCRIGGTSAGAIAAAVTAAAEYGRQTGAGEGLGRLETLVQDLVTPGLLLGLFQPAPPNRPLWSVARAATRPGSPAARAERAGIALMHARPTETLIGFALLLALGVLAAAGAATLDVLPAALLLVVALLLMVLVAVGTVALAAWRLGTAGYAALQASRYGFCPGARQEGRSAPALTDWLHAHIQACAGLPLDSPLTFALLEEKAGVELEMLTTDLGFARPVRCRAELAAYSFDPRELEPYLPEPVIRHMVAAADRLAPAEPGGLRRIPGAELPILAATRLSLSFPGLLSAVPLYRDGERHLFSDGGISSNFPIHFFDAWFPGRPTFGLDLAEHPADPDAPPVFLPGPTDPVQPRWSDVQSVVDFAVRIIDAMQNWRDTGQSELPGYRDRICQIRLQRGEGGLNLDMDDTTIARLVSRGESAGRLLRDDFQFAEHRWIRYLTSMRLLELGLQDVDAKFGGFGDELAAGMPDVGSYRIPYTAEWCPPAGEATRSLLAVAARWGVEPPTFMFDPPEGGPRPHPVMRIVPEA